MGIYKKPKNLFFRLLKEPSLINNLLKNLTIKDLERYSNIKAHTIRTWERRYAILHPERNKGNSRFYAISELERILNISLLNRSGYRISNLSAMGSDEIGIKISLLKRNEDLFEKSVNELILSMYSAHPENFETVLENAALTWPVDILLRKIIFTFLNRTGLFWCGNQLTYEHFVVTAIRKKLIAGIEKITVSINEKKKRRVLLFLATGKELDLALLYANFFLKLSGLDVLYMGNDVSLSNLKEVFSKMQPDFAFTYMPEKSSFQFGHIFQ